MGSTTFASGRIRIIISLAVMAVFFGLSVIDIVVSFTSEKYPSVTGAIDAVSSRYDKICWATATVYHYTFSVDGRVYEGQFRIYDRSNNPLAHLNTGSGVQVYYLSEFPSVSTIAPNYFNRRPLLFNLLWGLVGLGIFIHALCFYNDPSA